MLLTLVLGVAPAYAVTCSGGGAAAFTNTTTGICTIELTHANVTELDGAIDVRVTWDNSGTATVFSVQWISGGPGTPKFISEFAYNNAVLTSSVSGNDTAWTLDADGSKANQVDGFGKFFVDNMSADGNSGISSPLVFTLASEILSVASNDGSPNVNNAHFAVHVAGYAGGCSGFVSDGTSNSTTSNSTCGVVPEPGTLALVGSGLVSVGALLRRRLFNRGLKEVV